MTIKYITQEGLIVEFVLRITDLFHLVLCVECAEDGAGPSLETSR